MAEDPMIQTNGIRAWVRRFGDLLDLASKISLTTLLLFLLGVVLATYFGFLASPLATKSDLVEHNGLIAQYFRNRERLDLEVLGAIRDMRTEMIRNGQSYRIRTCSEIHDTDLRKRCVDS